MSKKVLIIGAGGVGNVVAHKCAMLTEYFSEVMLASRNENKCKAIAADERIGKSFLFAGIGYTLANPKLRK